MRSSKIMSLSLAAGGLFLTAGAMAQPIASATYLDLNGSWNGALFTATAVSSAAGGGLNSSGSVARLVSPIGTAMFDAGFASDLEAGFDLSLTFVPLGGGLGSGTGTFLITDDDGSTISGGIDGVWIDDSANSPGQVYFNGTLSNVVFTGTTFDGTNGGSFSTIFGGTTPPYDGAITQLFLSPPGNFFNSTFSDVPTGVTMQILPTPGALALMGVGGLVVGRRRR